MGTWPDGLLDAIGGLLRPGERLITLGASGRGKSTLIADLAAVLGARSRPATVLAADPGQPRWGPPACAALATLRDTPGDTPTWDLEALACTGSLDPVRHQGSYLSALVRLVRDAPRDAVVLVDAPGVVRGAVAVEFTVAVANTLSPAVVVAFSGDSQVSRLVAHLPLPDGCDVVWIRPSEKARRPARNAAKRLRTKAWDAYLGDAREWALDLDSCRIRRSPPQASWRGRLVGLLDAAGDTLAMAEVVRVDPAEPGVDGGSVDSLVVKGPVVDPARVRQVLVVNAAREADGTVRTLSRPGPPAPAAPTAWAFPGRTAVPVPISWPKGGGQAPYQPRLLNPATGDPALMLRQKRTGRALLFDLGWLEPLPTRLLHAVSDLFVTHAHMDHIQGLVTLLRVLLGPGGSLRVYGPPGLDEKIAALLSAFDFNLLGDGGPTFVVHTLEGDAVTVTRIRCAETPAIEALSRYEASGGLLLEEPGLVVRAATLSHSVPVLGYRCELWRDPQTLAPRARPPRRFRLAYVADARDSAENRAAILELAKGVDLFVCEARFTEAHLQRARETGHLTARACAHLARRADVGRLVPFHFSPRYEHDLRVVYREVLSGFDRVVPAVPMRAG